MRVNLIHPEYDIPIMTTMQDFAQRVARLHASLGISRDHIPEAMQQLHQEPDDLAFAGPDYYGREQFLAPEALRAWQAMQQQASRDGVILHVISAYRSVEYQCDLIRRKLDQGQSISRILRVNAAPGYSEHHTGRAIDIGTEDCPALEEAFENTPAFQWLRRHAGDYGFVLSYPRDNAAGIAYEPWHWCYRGGIGSGVDFT